MVIVVMVAVLIMATMMMMIIVIIVIISIIIIINVLVLFSANLIHHDLLIPYYHPVLYSFCCVMPMISSKPYLLWVSIPIWVHRIYA